MKHPLRIGITAGDINGIGPEVTLKALHRARWPANVRFVILGHGQQLAEQAHRLGHRAPPECPLDRPSARWPKVSWWDPCPVTDLVWQPGSVSPKAAEAAAGWITEGAKACMRGDLDGMVTAPICKEGFSKAGVQFPGHTEMLAHITRTKRYAMMLFGAGLRVVIVTRHDPIAEVPRLLTRKLIRDHIRLTAEALPWLGAAQARIAVCGLNPHAGESGTIGREEIDIIRPAVRSVQDQGFDIDGPLPADTVFHQAVHGTYDAVVAMYHDQGLAPLKLLAFDRGVNITLGLPIVRTSPDHGTAFNIAGKGVADHRSMREAIRTAVLAAGRPNPWKT